MRAHYRTGHLTRLWEAPVLWLQQLGCLGSSGVLGLPNGAVSSLSSPGTPTKTRPWEGRITSCLDQSSCAQPGQGWQS